MDISERIRNEWHGKWVWGKFVRGCKKSFANKASEPKPLERDEVNTFILLRKNIIIKGRIKNAELNISADSRYKLFINGNYIGRGINRCESNYWYYNKYNVTDVLKDSKNVIAIRARWFGWDFAYYTRPEYPKDNPEGAGKGGIIFDLKVEYENGEVEWFASDEDVKIIKDPEENQMMPLKSSCLGFIEERDSRNLPKDWNEVDFDDNSWEKPLILNYPINTLLLDENFPLYEEFYSPSEIIHIGENEDCIKDFDEEDLDEGIDFNIFHLMEMNHSPLESFEIIGKGNITKKGAVWELNPLENSKDKVFSLYVRFEKEMVGYPQMIVEGEEGTIIDIIPSEKTRGDDGPELDLLHAKRGMRCILRGGKQFFEQWTWEGYLYMLVKVRNLTGPLKFHKMGTNQTHMQTRGKGKFTSDNDELNNLWDACAHTVLCCAIDAYLDCPSREQRAYLGDAYPEALIANACFGEPRLTKKLIEDSCFGQRSDGIMYSFHPGDAKTHNHIIPDYTLYLIQITQDYYQYYGDENILIQTFAHFQLAMEWFWKFIDSKDGLLSNLPHWCFIDWSFAHDKPGKWAILNTQFMDVLNFLSTIAKKIGRQDLYKKYKNHAEKITISIEKIFWNENEGCYNDYYYEGELHGFSFMTNAYLILKDISPKQKWNKIVNRIFENSGNEENLKKQIDDFYLKNQSHHAFGDVLKSMVIVAQPFFMHHVNKAFAKMGRYDLIMKFLKKWIPMLTLGKTGTIWETWSIAGSECHAWAATPAYDLSTYWIGVSPLLPGFEKVIINPTFFELNYVDGVYPTCRGDIDVNWKKVSEGEYSITINLPEKIKQGIFIPTKLSGKNPRIIKDSQNNEISGKESIEVVNGENSFIIIY